MSKTNPIGGALICLVLLMLVGYAFSLALSLNWAIYFKVAGIIAAIGVIVGIIASGGDRS